MKRSKKDIYDKLIADKMDEIANVCVEHKIAFIAQFELANDERRNDTTVATSMLVSDDTDPSPVMLSAAEALLHNARMESPDVW